MGITEQTLIAAVSRNPALYDKTVPEYKSGSAREAGWKNVAKEMNVEDVDGLKKRWRTLRDAFIKHYRISSNARPGRAGHKKKWVYYDCMLFLLPHIESKQALDNNYEDEDDSSHVQEFGSHSGEDAINLDDDMRSEAADVAVGSLEEDSLGRVVEPRSYAPDPLKLYGGGNSHNRSAAISRRRKMPKKTLISEKLTELLTTNNDSDQQFLLSCLPILKSLPPRKNLQARIRIQSLLYNLRFGGEENTYEFSPGNSDCVSYTDTFIESVQKREPDTI